MLYKNTLFLSIGIKLLLTTSMFLNGCSDARLADQPEDYTRFGIPVEPGVIEEDARHMDLCETSFEWWYADGHFTDGSSVVVAFYTKPIFQPQHVGTKPGISIVLKRPSGEISDETMYLSAGEGSFSSTECDNIIGNNSFKEISDGVFEIIAHTENLSVDLTLTRTVPTWRPATGYLLFDETDYFAWLVEVPNGNIQGTITYDGQTINVSGSGYHDHNWGNCLAAGLFKYWWWSRVQIGPYTVIAASMRLKNYYKPEWIRYFGVLDTNGVVIDGAAPGVSVNHKVSSFDIHPDPLGYPNGLYPYCLEYSVNGPNNLECYLRMDSYELIYSVSPLQPVLGLEPELVELLQLLGIKPWYTSMSLDTYLEFDLDGTHYQGASNTGTKELADMDGNRLFQVGKKRW